MSEQTKLNAKSREMFTIVYAASDVLNNCKEDFKRIAERVENGCEAYEQISQNLDRLISDIVKTIPPKQCYTIAKQMEVSEIKFATKRAMAKEEQYWAIDRESLAVLTEAAIGSTCLLCDGKKRNCKLKEVLDDMPVVIEDRNLYIACREGDLNV